MSQVPLCSLVPVDGEHGINGQGLPPAGQVDHQEVRSVAGHVVVELQALGLVGAHEKRRVQVGSVVLPPVIVPGVDEQVMTCDWPNVKKKCEKR